MSKIDYRSVIVGSMMGVIVVGGGYGCAGVPRNAAVSPRDPNARQFSGTIVSLRPNAATMLVSKDEHVGRDQFPNIVAVRYDAGTKFLLDAKPATLDQIQQYMNVAIAGHMREGQLFAETAAFSSVLPANVKKAGG